MHEGKNEEAKHRRARLISTDFLPSKSKVEVMGLGDAGINSHDCVRSIIMSCPGGRSSYPIKMYRDVAPFVNFK